MATIEYVFINKQAPNCVVIDDSFTVELGLSNKDRPPNQIIELISMNVETLNEHPYIQVRSTLTASNSYTNDGYQSCIGVLAYDQQLQVGAHHTYILSSYEQPKYVISNTNKFLMGFIGGVYTIPEAQILNFVCIFKITTPAQGEIQKDYRKQIPL